MEFKDPRIMQIHHDAMKALDNADKAMRDGDRDKWQSLLSMAARLETQAAEFVTDLNDQPTRGVLYRSAANLCYQAGDMNTAMRMAKEGRRGPAPASIVNEMRQMIRSITGTDPGEVDPEPTSEPAAVAIAEPATRKRRAKKRAKEKQESTVYVSPEAWPSHVKLSNDGILTHYPRDGQHPNLAANLTGTMLKLHGYEQTQTTMSDGVVWAKPLVAADEPIAKFLTQDERIEGFAGFDKGRDPEGQVFDD